MCHLNSQIIYIILVIIGWRVLPMMIESGDELEIMRILSERIQQNYEDNDHAQIDIMFLVLKHGMI